MDELEKIKQKKLRDIMQHSKKSYEDWEDKPVDITDRTFQQLIQKYSLVVVDCWATWCAPCKMIAPIVEELAHHYKGRVVFGKLDVDSNPITARNYKIMSIPTLLIFKKGQLVDQIIGAISRQILENKITQHL